MDNYDISDALGFYAKLAELHDENPFRVKAFSAAAFNIKKIKDPIAGMNSEKMDAIPGVGKSVLAAIKVILETNTFPELEKLLTGTPEGILQMLRIKGLGPKKVQTIWRTMGIETVEELFDACRENRLVELPGFGLKTQGEVMRAIEFSWANRGKFHYARVEKAAEEVLGLLKKSDPGDRHEFTGEFRRKCEVIEDVEILTTAEEERIQKLMTESGFEATETGFKDALGHRFVFLYATKDDFDLRWFETTGSSEHLKLLGDFRFGGTEESVYTAAGMPYIIPEMREGRDEIERRKASEGHELLEYTHIRGSLHNHSTYSDGLHSLREMAEYCRDLGYEYLGICDHSKSAGYAHGLQVERVLQQFEEIDQLNAELAPFYIFKGIESDILGDGSLDYEPEILAKFEMVVASVHSNLKMNEEVANQRLVRAIENPYTHILGHPTGRLLLLRAGYPIDHRYIIDACAANGVAIELNANPYRLDLDWRWIGYAMDRGVMLSINPDAHEKHAHNDMYYGTLAARKGGLTRNMTLNTLDREALAQWLAAKRSRAVR